MSEIIPGLYLGNENDSKNVNKYDIIVNCTPNLKFYSNKPNIRIPINDNGDPREVEKFYNIISDLQILQYVDNELKNNKKVLIHCRMGQQRSAAFVATYLIYKYQIHPVNIIEYIKSKKSDAFLMGVNFSNAINHFYNLRNQSNPIVTPYTSSFYTKYQPK